MKKIRIWVVCAVCILLLAGCMKHVDMSNAATVSVGGPYGRLSVQIPEGWTAEAVAPDADKSKCMSFGLYGLVLKPEAADNGHIELFVHEVFGVCGTGLRSEEKKLGAYTAYVGTYDRHSHWDFIVFGKDYPRLVAWEFECDFWTEDMWDEADAILSTLQFDKSVTEGSVE